MLFICQSVLGAASIVYCLLTDTHTHTLVISHYLCHTKRAINAHYGSYFNWFVQLKWWGICWWPQLISIIIESGVDSFIASWIMNSCASWIARISRFMLWPMSHGSVLSIAVSLHAHIPYHQYWINRQLTITVNSASVTASDNEHE